jgi:hypothetical protein
MTAILEPVAIREPVAAEPVAPESVAPETPVVQSSKTLAAPVQEPILPAEPVAAAPVARPVRPRRVYPAVQVSRLVGALTAAAWIIAVAVEPVPNGPRPVPSAWDLLISNLSMIALGVAIWGLVRARSWGPAAGIVNGGLLVTLTALCPATGHHVIAGWWWAQLALTSVMLAAPVALLAARRLGRLR